MQSFVPVSLPPNIPGTGDSRPSDLTRRIVRLQLVTLAWMLIECCVSIASAKAARSPALLAFGSDSLVELLSAAVVLPSLLPSARFKRKATQMAGILLLVLAAVIAVTATLALVYGLQPEASLPGIGITAAALVAMPVLAWKKRALARATNNRALAADAVQSATCAYLAAITLLGLGLNALFHLPWVDSVAGLVAIPTLVIEGRRAVRGESCSCC